jgi:Adenylate and Guanylate cyclase catalytic domain
MMTLAGQRVPCSVLAMDIVSYSLEFDETQARLVATLSRILDETLSDAHPDTIVLPSGDGAFVVFVGRSSEVALDCILSIHRKVRDGLHDLRLRAGITEGPLLIIAGPDGHPHVVGTTINVAQRVMDVGDAGHITLSETAYSTLAASEQARGRLAPMTGNPVEVKHGVRLNLYQYRDGGIGSWDCPAKLESDVGIRSVALGRNVDWPELVQTDHSLRMVDLSMPLFGIPGLLDRLEQMLKGEITIQVLLLNPMSATMEVRRSSNAYDTPVELTTTLDYVVKILLGFRQRLEQRCGVEASRRFDARLFDGIPSMSAFIADTKAFVSFYLEHLSGSRGPFVTVAGTTPMYDCISTAFDTLWNERSVSIYDPALNTILSEHRTQRLKALERLELPGFLV